MPDSAAIKAVAVHAFRVELLAGIHERANAWRDEEVQARVNQDDLHASLCHAKAVVLEELGRDLERRDEG